MEKTAVSSPDRQETAFLALKNSTFRTEFSKFWKDVSNFLLL
jgi:hypothetical protein